MLVVDDTVINLKAVERMLKPFKQPVSMAQSGRAALDIIQARLDRDEPMFRLVFMDVQMPYMDGLETCTKLRRMLGQSRDKTKRRRDKKNRRPFVCGVTAITKDNVQDMTRRAGMDDFYIRPLYKDYIEDTLRAAGFRI